MKIHDDYKTVDDKPKKDTKHISRTNSGKYSIEKSINHRSVYYGSFDTLDEAIKYRDEILIPNEWDPEYIKQRYKKDDRYVHPTDHGTYVINKWHDGKHVYYGTFLTKNEAIQYRDEVLIPNNWDESLIKIKNKFQKPPEEVEEISEQFKEWMKKEKYHKTTIQRRCKTLQYLMITKNLTTKDEVKEVVKGGIDGISVGTIGKWLGVSTRNYGFLSMNSMKNEVMDDEYVINFQKERNIQESTMASYYASIAMYLKLCGFKNCNEMIEEALEEEKERVPIKESKISEHLKKYLLYLQDRDDFSTSTVHTYFTKLETFYRHHNITIPQRQPLQAKSEYHMDYYDLPSKDMIKTAIQQSNNLFASMIYFMSSSGTALAETLSITVGMFIDGLREYTDKTEPELVVDELKDRRDLVPVISLVRQKTNIPYYTCCSPEATYHILEYMMINEKNDREEKLWNISKNGVLKTFNRINDTNKWGKVGPYRRFRSHMLRKFHASNLGCSYDLINMLEGRTNGRIHETYVKQRPDQLKERYTEHMHNVMINTKDYVGPHLGGLREEEKLKQSIVELVPDLVPTLEQASNAPQSPSPKEPNNNTIIPSVSNQQVVVPSTATNPSITINGNVNIINLDQAFITNIENLGLNVEDFVKQLLGNKKSV